MATPVAASALRLALRATIGCVRTQDARLGLAWRQNQAHPIIVHGRHAACLILPHCKYVWNSRIDERTREVVGIAGAATPPRAARSPGLGVIPILESVKLVNQDARLQQRIARLSGGKASVELQHNGWWRRRRGWWRRWPRRWRGWGEGCRFWTTTTSPGQATGSRSAFLHLLVNVLYTQGTKPPAVRT